MDISVLDYTIQNCTAVLSNALELLKHYNTDEFYQKMQGYDSIAPLVCTLFPQ